MRLIIGLGALALLAACGGKDRSDGGVTSEESRQLNEAAEMLDASPDSLAATDNAALGNGEAAAQTSLDGAAADNLAANSQ